MIRFKIIIVLTLLFFSTNLIFSQENPKRPRGQGHPFPEQLKTELKLSEEQQTKLDSLKQAFAKEFRAIRNQDFESHEDRRRAMRELRTVMQESFENILTEEQVAILEEKRQNGKGHPGKGQRHDKGEEVRNAVKAYHEQNIRPAVLEQRQKLEPKISEEDRATLAELRQEISEKRGEKPKGRRGRLHRGEITEEQKAARMTMKGLVDKYGEEIESHIAVLETNREQWQKDLKEIVGERKQAGRKGARRRGKMHKQQGELGTIGIPGKSRFLLLDPNGEDISEEVNPDAPNELQVYPNPSSSTNTINFKVREEGKIRLELRRENGSVIKVLMDEYKEEGSYNRELDLSDLHDGIYYLTIVDDKGRITTEKIIVSK